MTGRPIALNGKFLTAAPSGVHRVAEALIAGVDQLLAKAPESAELWEMMTPHSAERSLPLNVIKTRKIGVLTWQPWEQFELPWHARNSLLVNLCNLAPIASRGAITMIHDAQVFISPESYSKAFRSWYQFALPQIGKSASRVLTVSEYSRQKLVEYGVASLEKIDVIHNGVDHLRDIQSDPRILDRLPIQRRGYVVALANTQVHKNIPVLLRAFAALERQDLKLVLVGGHGAEDFIQAGHTPPPNAVFAGRVTDGELRALYSEAVCLAFPSRTEGFGLPPLEAMAADCPTIAAPCGALPEVCGDAALYVDPDDSEGWAAAIITLSQDSELRDRLIQAGRLQAAKFSWARSSERLLEIIRQVNAEGGGRV